MRPILPFFVLSLGAGWACAITPQLEPKKISQSSTVSAPHGRAYNAAGNIIFNSNFNDKSGVDVVGSKVAVTNAYLLPSDAFFEESRQGGDGAPNQFRDAAFLCVEVANISSQPLLVTAMKLDIIDQQKLGLGPGIVALSCPQEKVSGVGPECLLQPGQRKKWFLQKGIVMHGAADFLKQQSDEYVIDTERPRRTNNDDVIDHFNAFLRAAVGARTTLRVSIYELNYKPILTGHFRLAEGADMFTSEPVLRKIRGKETLVFPLQHDSFLGEALTQLKNDRDLRQRNTARRLSCGQGEQ